MKESEKKIKFEPMFFLGQSNIASKHCVAVMQTASDCDLNIAHSVISLLLNYKSSLKQLT